MTKLLSDYCVYVENHMSLKICDDIVDFFESVPNKKRVETKDSRPRFTEFNFTRESSLNEELHKTICQYLLAAVEDYRTEIKNFSVWAPKNLYFQHLRIKRYISEDKDEFDTHVDVGSTKNAGRYLSFQWYLNDVSDGGETEFTELDFKIKPKKGALLMFPPVWMFPHKGNLLNSGKKYILSSYLLYPEPVLKLLEAPQLPKFKLFEGFQ